MKKYQLDIEKSTKIDRTQAIKSIRVVGKMPLKTASDACAYLQAAGRITLAAGLEKKHADKLAAILGKHGIAVAVNESTVLSPLVFHKDVEKLYDWNGFRSLQEIR